MPPAGRRGSISPSSERQATPAERAGDAAPFTVLTVIGTRPEAVKLAPVIRALAGDPDLRSRVLCTAQHRELLDQMLEVFGIVPDVDLDLMRPGHTLAEVTARVLQRMDAVLTRDRPDLVLVQGDTTTVFASALAAFYRGVPVGHVEAGLRSFDLANPFPEEANRRLAAQLTTLHFAPTGRARDNLLREGVDPTRVFLTGNTVVDAIQAVLRERLLPPPPAPWRALPSKALPVYVTLHRRESWGEPLAGIFRALRRAADELPTLHLLYPVHPQPRVRETAERLLRGHPRIALVEPLDYLENVACLQRCAFVVTDSGGLQEEAPVLGKPVLVTRSVTERPEAVEAGMSWLVGTREDAVYAAVMALAADPSRREAMGQPASPFGDGRAAGRILAAIRAHAGLAPSPDAPPPLRGAE